MFNSVTEMLDGGTQEFAVSLANHLRAALLSISKVNFTKMKSFLWKTTKMHKTMETELSLSKLLEALLFAITSLTYLKMDIIVNLFFSFICIL